MNKAKIYRATITYELRPDAQGLFEWQEEDEQGRTVDELIQFAREEMYELITNGVKYNDIWNMIDVEVIDE